MVFEDIADRLTALFDVTRTRAVAVANDRLQDMVTRSTALRAVISLGTTVDGTASYTLAANVAKVLKVKIAWTNGTVNYEGSESIEALWDIDTDQARVVDSQAAYWFAVEPDADATMTTDNLRIYPTPAESGKAITGLVALRPAVLTYATNTALPIPTDKHQGLLEGCKAVLFADESRQDEAAVPNGLYEAAIVSLYRGMEKRAKGTRGHRIAVAGYDFAR